MVDSSGSRLFLVLRTHETAAPRATRRPLLGPTSRPLLHEVDARIALAGGVTPPPPIPTKALRAPSHRESFRIGFAVWKAGLHASQTIFLGNVARHDDSLPAECPLLAPDADHAVAARLTRIRHACRVTRP